MKKVLLSLAAAVLVFTGCGKKVDRLEEFKTAFSKIESAEMKIEAKMGLEQDGMNVDVNIPMTMKVSEKGLYVKLEKNTFIEQNIELYGLIEKEKMTLYIPSIDEESNVIENAKIRTIENSTYSIIDAVRMQYMENLLSVDGGEVPLNGNVKDLKISGEHAISGTWYIDNTQTSTTRGIIVTGVKFDSMMDYTCSNGKVENWGETTQKITFNDEYKVVCSKDDNVDEKVTMKLELDLNDENFKDFTENLDEAKVEMRDLNKYLTDKVIVFVEEKDGLDYYQFVINDDLLKKIAEDNDEEYENVNMEIKFDVYIDSKTKTLSKIEFDLKEFFNDYMNSDLADEESLEDFDVYSEMIKTLLFTIEFKNVNNTTITIPQDVIDNAVDISGLLDMDSLSEY